MAASDQEFMDSTSDRSSPAAVMCVKINVSTGSEIKLKADCVKKPQINKNPILQFRTWHAAQQQWAHTRVPTQGKGPLTSTK